MRTRKSVVQTALRFGGRPAGSTVKRFAVQVVELAYVRDRIDRGFGDERVSRCRTRRAPGGGCAGRGGAGAASDSGPLVSGVTVRTARRVLLIAGVVAVVMAITVLGYAKSGQTHVTRSDRRRPTASTWHSR